MSWTTAHITLRTGAAARSSRRPTLRVSFFTHWQPLHNEDAHTALVFGYLRHAPAKHGLEPWLTATIARPVTAPELEHGSFWPAYLSGHEGQQRTFPDLGFDANDGGQLLVLVEVKPGFLGARLRPDQPRDHRRAYPHRSRADRADHGRRRP